MQENVQHLTHGLKSPITAIQAALELIAPNMPPADQAHFLAQIKAQSKRVQTIIENMLGLASLEHQQQQLQQVSHVNLDELVQTQIGLLASKAAQHNIQFKTEQSDIAMPADSFLLGQAIVNLLENAFDFSPPNSEITVQITENLSQVSIAIHDAGSGIPDNAQTKIFDKFYSLPRPENTPNAGQKSTGFGLNFVQEVAKLHGGGVSLNNHADGGVLAVITLPK